MCNKQIKIETADQFFESNKALLLFLKHKAGEY